MDVSNHAPGTPTWVDLQSPNPEAARGFYGKVLGWTYHVGPPETGFYAMACVRNRQVAGIGPKPPGVEMPSTWTTYFESADADATAAKIKALGGHVMMGPMDVMDAGRMIVAADPTGGVFGIWQSGKHRGYEASEEHGAPAWHELTSRDLPKSLDFYGKLTGLAIANANVPGMDYFIARHGETMVAGMMGMHSHAPAGMPSNWTIYFSVDSCDDAVAKVRANGGSVMSEPMDTPYGRMAMVADPFGAAFAVMQPPKK